MRTASRRAIIGTAALAMGLIAFLFRLALFHDLSNDHYMHMAWAQQLLFGQLPGRDFVDPGMPLQYALSALVQWMYPGPFSEGVLSCAMLGLAAAATLVATVDLTGSIAVGIGAALCEIALEPRLYSYPKILVPAVALVLMQRYVRSVRPAEAGLHVQPAGVVRPAEAGLHVQPAGLHVQPARAAIVWMSAWTGIAVLFRHDLGVYAAAGFGAGMVAVHSNDLARMVRALAEYAVALIVLMLPYTIYVQWSEGLLEHLHAAVEFAKGEAHQRFLTPPSFPFWSDPRGFAAWNRIDAATFLFYALHLAAVIAMILLARPRPAAKEQRPVAIAGVAMLLLYLTVVLRHTIETRLPDVGALMVIMGGWLLAESFRRARWLTAAVAMLVAASLVNVWVLDDFGGRVMETRITEGPNAVVRTIESAKESGTTWPWDRYWPAGELRDAVRYLNSCTSRDDAVMLTWAAPEFYFFAQRRFAAGHALFLPPDAFTTVHDRERMLAQIHRERIPVVLINETRRAEFARAYPEIDRYITEGYAPAGHFDIRDGSTITVAIGRQFKGDRTYQGWPCGFESRA